MFNTTSKGFMKAQPFKLLAALLVVTGLTACGNFSMGGDASTGPPTAILLGFHKGEQFRFKFAEQLEGELIGNNKDINEKIAVSGIEDLNVLGFTKAGDMIVDFWLEKVRATENGKSLKVPGAGKHFHVVIGKDGQIKSGDELNTRSSNSLASTEVPGGDQFTPMTPGGKKAQPGDSWQQSFDRPFGDGTIHEDDTTQFVKYDTINGNRAALIQTTYSVPGLNVSLSMRSLFQQCGCAMDDGSNPRIVFTGSLSGVDRVWIDTKHDQLLKSDSTGFFDIQLGLRDFPPQAEPNGDYDWKGSEHLTVESLKIAAGGTVL